MSYCCAMRRHFVLGIVAVRRDEPCPTEALDFIVAWEPKVVIQVKFCPFCGKEVEDTEERRIV